MNKLLIGLVFLLIVLTVSAQEAEPGKQQTFADICPGNPAPVFTPAGSSYDRLGVYLITQYVNYSGDVVVVFFGGTTTEIARQVFQGDWCDAL